MDCVTVAANPQGRRRSSTKSRHSSTCTECRDLSFGVLPLPPSSGSVTQSIDVVSSPRHCRWVEVGRASTRARPSAERFGCTTGPDDRLCHRRAAIGRAVLGGSSVGTRVQAKRGCENHGENRVRLRRVGRDVCQGWVKRAAAEKGYVKMCVIGSK